ncbi:hypothetical protein BJ684DRAFT_22916 [Piptocephalis cylindrospora]|uniref:FAD synthase n=1 Tax=Piptocephalis cylindrospora TaxID=1907219 RepID=A0A4P9Y4B8_9FUNG|nr:hypothetical protein BJ684DRAFT_22916 [Piptocephalis cylindrospora]|eukprot:RKP12981.1 hypothetical protein BJ684DRAFT_22916 [Piptocephalis cylindrospora]
MVSTPAHSYHARSLLSDDSPSSTISSSTRSRLEESLQLLRQVVETYGEGLALSFNGGKDCTLLLYLLCAALEDSETMRSKPLPTVYITHNHPFNEVDEFIDQCVSRYGLSLARENEPMKEGLSHFLSSSPIPVQAILVGIRFGDPYSSNLQDIQATDRGWPVFTRIHPVLRWTHDEVWEVLRAIQLPYCSLYDHGYTSLGGTNDTRPNPALALPPNAQGVVEYAPAWKLTDSTKERDCRVKK